jgi:mevalonate kinase
LTLDDEDVMNMHTGRGYGKVILFNEHFVVHRVPAIVSGIGDYTEAEVCSSGANGDDCPGKGKGVIITDLRPATEGYKDKKLQDQADSIKYILEALGKDPESDLHIKLGGPLYAASGVGASAASCAAIARALGAYFDLELSDERVNELAFEGEKGYHGTPSGIDNSAATYGGLLMFEKTGGAPKIDPFSLKQPVEIVMGNTGIVANTKAAVDGVKQRKEQYPERYDDIFARARELAGEARTALEAFELEKVGALMNRNHELLQEIEVSHELLEKLVDIARGEGAPGAKLTGGGLGGYMVALTPGVELQEKVAAAMEAEGFKTLKTTIK